jgi:hypothetical protein
VASILRTGVQIDFCPEIRILFRRDYRTQPGVLPRVRTKRGPALKVAAEKRFPPWMPNEILNEFLPPHSSFVPYSQNYGGQAGRGPIVNVSWG